MKKKNLVGVLFLIPILASGCSQIDSNPFARDPDELLSLSREHLANHRYDLVIDIATPFASDPGPYQGLFSLELARAHAARGNADLAIMSLKTALKKDVITGQELLMDEHFKEISTTIEFLTVITSLE